MLELIIHCYYPGYSCLCSPSFTGLAQQTFWEPTMWPSTDLGTGDALINKIKNLTSGRQASQLCVEKNKNQQEYRVRAAPGRRSWRASQRECPQAPSCFKLTWPGRGIWTGQKSAGILNDCDVGTVSEEAARDLTGEMNTVFQNQPWPLQGLQNQPKSVILATAEFSLACWGFKM